MLFFKAGLSACALLLFASGCATFDRGHYDDPEAAKAPEWVYAPSENCMIETQLCAVGEGESLTQADARAKTSLAGIFESQVSSHFSRSYKELDEKRLSSIRIQTNTQVQETVDDLLKGAKISKRFERDGIHYSFAVLKKATASEIFLREIKVIDDELSYLYLNRKRAHVYRMLSLLEKRRHYEDKLSVLQISSPNAPVSFLDVRSLALTNKTMPALALSGQGSAPRSLIVRFQELASDLGFAFAPMESAHYIIKLDLDRRPLHLNVEGFEKYLFRFFATARQADRREVGALELSVEQVGRSEDDALNKALDKFKKQIKDNFDQLNLE